MLCRILPKHQGHPKLSTSGVHRRDLRYVGEYPRQFPLLSEKHDYILVVQKVALPEVSIAQGAPPSHGKNQRRRFFPVQVNDGVNAFVNLIHFEIRLAQRLARRAFVHPGPRTQHPLP